MTVAERAVVFHCEGDQLVGILCEPLGTPEVGIIVVVGGPQYRVGSHRQFVLLARAIAAHQIPALRFDYRGMGDSSGAMLHFDEVTSDLAAAIDIFFADCPSLQRVVIWGLCDAASAALLYWQTTRDSRVAGMVLLNPWVRSEESLARAHVKHYYGPRLLEREFWAKVISGKLDIAGALRSFVRSASMGFSTSGGAQPPDSDRFQDRMALGMAGFPGPILLILSGRDLTAKEFSACCKSEPGWQGLLERENVERHDLPDADHTFSTAAWRQEIETLTVGWLKRSFAGGQ